MGMAIGNPSDLQIVFKLDIKFDASATGLTATRNMFGNETAFDDRHSLSRVAYRLGAFPTDATARGRWFYLLDHVKNSLPQPLNTIRTVLADALQNIQITQVIFGVMQDPNNGPDYSA